MKVYNPSNQKLGKKRFSTPTPQHGENGTFKTGENGKFYNTLIHGGENIHFTRIKDFASDGKSMKGYRLIPISTSNEVIVSKEVLDDLKKSNILQEEFIESAGYIKRKNGPNIFNAI